MIIYLPKDEFFKLRKEGNYRLYYYLDDYGNVFLYFIDNHIFCYKTHLVYLGIDRHELQDFLKQNYGENIVRLAQNIL